MKCIISKVAVCIHLVPVGCSRGMPPTQKTRMNTHNLLHALQVSAKESLGTNKAWRIQAARSDNQGMTDEEG